MNQTLTFLIQWLFELAWRIRGGPGLTATEAARLAQVWDSGGRNRGQ
jgi:hypothetical protein